jgi:hypothetical protein
MDSGGSTPSGRTVSLARTAPFFPPVFPAAPLAGTFPATFATDFGAALAAAFPTTGFGAGRGSAFFAAGAFDFFEGAACFLAGFAGFDFGREDFEAFAFGRALLLREVAMVISPALSGAPLP